VNEGQLQLGYAETKKRPGEVRSEATLQGMTAFRLTTAKKVEDFAPSRVARIPEKMSADDASH